MNREAHNRRLRKVRRIGKRRGEAAAFFTERQARADFAAFDQLIKLKGGEPPRSDDKLE